MALPIKKKQRLGELFVEQGLITTNQLKDALRKQAQVGGQLGSILVEMGYITIDTLLSFLSRQLGIPSVNLMKLDISRDILKLMPLEKIQSMKVLPISISESAITLAMVNPRDMIAIRDIEFSFGRKVNPVVVAASQMEAAIQSLVSHPETGLTAETIEKEFRKTDGKKAPSLITLLKYLSSSSATDMMITAGVPPSIKVGNDLRRASMDLLTPADCEKYARELITENDWDIFERKGDFNIAVTFPEIGRFRVNIFKQRNSVAITLRYISDILPTIEELNLPDWIKEYVLTPQGLILVSSPAGHGKTTTLTAMVDVINSVRKCNIITFEDPIEYLHKHKKSNVNQREIGTDTESLHEGMKYVYRHNPDVLVIGELCDAESFSLALQAATSHLVIATVQAGSAVSTIDRVINFFPPNLHNLMRTRLADNLHFIFFQRLIPLMKVEGCIPAYENIINNAIVNNFIRSSKPNQIRSQMLGGAEDLTSMEASLARLYAGGLIKYEDGLLYSENKQFYKDLTKGA